ncbi:hypothetical protein DVH24_009881 [Malus domestica]|uniref:Uncharacterized protein n=1 Tax=Malus domestica TaxID=3750 RepID=A0A498JR91_MALDO|nr:hypothetical protein DVH24_009881 [Malus domestica]
MDMNINQKILVMKFLTSVGIRMLWKRPRHQPVQKLMIRLIADSTTIGHYNFKLDVADNPAHGNSQSKDVRRRSSLEDLDHMWHLDSFRTHLQMAY